MTDRLVAGAILGQVPAGSSRPAPTVSRSPIGVRLDGSPHGDPIAVDPPTIDRRRPGSDGAAASVSPAGEGGVAKRRRMGVRRLATTARIAPESHRRPSRRLRPRAAERHGGQIADAGRRALPRDWPILPDLSVAAAAGIRQIQPSKTGAASVKPKMFRQFPTARRRPPEWPSAIPVDEAGF
ncbi:MAG: hypothetical protein ABSG83_02535 [Roseiarcus sp.]